MSTSLLRGSKNALRNTMKKYCPEILMGVGVTSLFSSTVHGVFASYKVKELWDAKEKEKGEPLTRKEKFLIAWKHYIITAILSIGGAACVISADTIHYRRNAALATLCTVAETTLTDYKEEASKLLGPQKIKELEGAADAKKIEHNPPTEDCVISTGRGNTLMYEPISNYYFRSSISEVESVLVRADSMRNSGDDVLMNDIYYMLGLPNCVAGELTGFPAEDPLGHYLSETYIYETYRKEACLTPNGEPCVQIIINAKLMDTAHYGEGVV